MKRIIMACLGTVAISLGSAFAQDSLIGKYTGSVEAVGGGGTPMTQGLVLVIESVQGGIVKGNADYAARGVCQGQYPMAGKYDGKQLRMRSTQKSGAGGDCSLGFILTVQGNKLVGTAGGGQKVQLSK